MELIFQRCFISTTHKTRHATATKEFFWLRKIIEAYKYGIRPAIVPQVRVFVLHI